VRRPVYSLFLCLHTHTHSISFSHSHSHTHSLTALQASNAGAGMLSGNHKMDSSLVSTLPMFPQPPQVDHGRKIQTRRPHLTPCRKPLELVGHSTCSVFSSFVTGLFWQHTRLSLPPSLHPSLPPSSPSITPLIFVNHTLFTHLFLSLSLSLSPSLSLSHKCE
jgi:hypothetical protein